MSKGKMILIVDDEAYMRRLIEQTLEDLEDLGVELITADNGERAIELAQEESPQLIFLDVMIPKLNGFEVCRKIKQELKMGETTIAMLTAKGQEYDLMEAQAAGADLYITKPFDPDELYSLAKRVLKVD